MTKFFYFPDHWPNLPARLPPGEPRGWRKTACNPGPVISTGQVTVITATEFKAKCLHLLDEVQRTGQDIVISKRGKPVARVVAEKALKPWLSLRGKGRFNGDAFEPVVKESEIDALK